MSVLVVWLLVGIPALVVGLALFVGRSPQRALLGYLVLAVGFAVVASVDPPSAAVLGGLLALLYAAGRGGAMEQQDWHDDEGVPDVAQDEGRGHVGAG